MTSNIDTKKMYEFCKIPVDQIEGHPELKVKIKIYETKDDVYQWVAQDMLEEVIRNNDNGKTTRWILPCGPTKQYPYFVKWVNEKKVNLKHVHVFHMDDHLDWQGRPISLDNPFSYEGWMRKNFYGLIEDTLNVPEGQRHFPSVFSIEEISHEIEKVGGIDTTYGGIGYRGLIAYNEEPRSPWYSVSIDEYKESKTRIVHLNDDTLIALSQRATGGCSHIIPPKAITLGMKDILSSRRIRFISDTGAWKRTVIRYFLFGDPTIEYPVTLTQDHPDVMVVVDRDTALPPLGN
jgi:glucosamine-6-phosphate deaminase